MEICKELKKLINLSVALFDAALAGIAPTRHVNLLAKATGYSVNSTEYGVTKNILEHVTEKCFLVEKSTAPNSPAILQKTAICVALENS
jgi:hypothetical protein